MVELGHGMKVGEPRNRKTDIFLSLVIVDLDLCPVQALGCKSLLLS